MRKSELFPKEQVFRYEYEGKVIFIAVDRLIRKLAATSKETIIDVEETLAKKLIADRSYDEKTVHKYMKDFTKIAKGQHVPMLPGIVIWFKDNTWTLADGNNKYVAAYMTGTKNMRVWEATRQQWASFIIKDFEGDTYRQLRSFSRAEIEDANPKECWVDGKRNISDQHHIAPVEYGGPKEGLTVPLCPTCHRNVHREASAIIKQKPPGVFVNEDNYEFEDQREKAMFLVHYIVQAKQRFDAKGEKKAVGARNMTQVSFTRQELAIAHDLKKMLGFKSLERCIKYVILEKRKQIQKQGK